MFKMKLSLRKLRWTDLFRLAKALKHPEVAEKLTYKFKSPLLRSLEELIKRKNTYKFIVLSDGNIVGFAVLENPNKDKTIYEVGFFVARDYWGKGIATEAVKKIVRFGFQDLKLKKIIGANEISNPPSGKVFKKAGFKKTKINKKKGFVYWEREIK